MIMRGFRPHFRSIWRTFAWSEVYFVVTIVVDLITGVNYGYLLHKPQAASLLSFLSDNWPVYLLQMHLLALVFFFVALCCRLRIVIRVNAIRAQSRAERIRTASRS